MQEQHDIAVQFIDGTQAESVRTGNNAAWACKCGRKKPLIGYSDEIDSPRDYSKVECPSCGRLYRVVALGLKQVPTHVQEIHVG